MIRVAVSIPTRGTVEADFMVALVQLFAETMKQRPEVELRLHYVASSILLQNRHSLVRFAQMGEATHMLWLDDDMNFPPDTLIKLLSHDKAVVGCNCPTRTIPVRSLAMKDGKPIKPSIGLGIVDHFGMGIALTKMEVFNSLEAPFFYFGWSPKDEEYVGEDVWFSRKARAAGYEIWVDHDLSREIGHIGKLEFTHDMVSADEPSVIL